MFVASYLKRKMWLRQLWAGSKCRERQSYFLSFAVDKRAIFCYSVQTQLRVPFILWRFFMFQDLGISSDHPFASDLCLVLAFLEDDRIAKAMQLAEAIPDPEVKRIALMVVCEEDVNGMLEQAAYRTEIGVMLSFETSHRDRAEAILGLIEFGMVPDVQVACTMALEEIREVPDPSWSNNIVGMLATLVHQAVSPQEVIISSVC